MAFGESWEDRNISWFPEWQKQQYEAMGLSQQDGQWGRQYGRAGTDEGWFQTMGTGEGSFDAPTLSAPSQDWLNQQYSSLRPWNEGFNFDPNDPKMQVYQEMDRLTRLRDYNQSGYAAAGGDARLKQLQDFANQNYSSKGSMLSRFMGSPAFPLMAGVVGGGLAYDAGLFGGAGSLGAETGAGEMFGMTGMEGAPSPLSGGFTPAGATLGGGPAAYSPAVTGATPYSAIAAPGVGAAEASLYGLGGAGATELGGGSWLSEAVGSELTSGAPTATGAADYSGGMWSGGGPGEALTGPTGALGPGATAPAGLSIPDFLKLGLPVAAATAGLFGGGSARQDLGDEQARLRAAFERSDPFAEARKSAGDQYLEWQQDPSKYMNSPIARLQLDEMNREAQRKNAMLGQTWNVDNEGNIRGSGTGATEFARQLQFNMAKQYEQALGNRAQQAGMSLFPNQAFSEQLANNAASRQGVRKDMYGNIIGLAGSLGNLYSKYEGPLKKIFGA